MKKMNSRTLTDEPVASLTNVSLVDVSTNSSSSNENAIETVIATKPQDANSAIVGEIDVNILEGNELFKKQM